MVTRLFPPYYAGATIQALYLSRELERQGQQVEFVTENFEQPSIEVMHEGFKVMKLSTFRWGTPLDKIRELLFAGKVLIFVMQRDYQVVHVHGGASLDMFLFPVLRILGIRSLLELTLVGSDDPLTMSRRKLGPLFRWSLGWADCVVAISRRLYELSLEGGLAVSRVRIIPVGVDTTRFMRRPHAEVQQLKDRLGFQSYRHVFISIGAVEERKGYDFMLKAWKYVNQQFENSVLLIIGPRNDTSNPSFNKLVALQTAGSIRNVMFLGMKERVDEYLAIADGYFHCALAEGLPNALLEAGAAAVPIICRHIHGVTSDVILNSAIGCEYHGASAKGFAEAILTTLRRHDPVAAQAETQKLRTRFDIRNIASQYASLYQEICYGT